MAKKLLKVVLLGGAVWGDCPLTPVEEFHIDADATADAIASNAAPLLWWLPPEEARRVATEAVEKFFDDDPTPTLAGWAYSGGDIVPEPPPWAVPYEPSRLGDYVYIVPGEKDPQWEDLPGLALEPYYIYLALEGEVLEF